MHVTSSNISIPILDTSPSISLEDLENAFKRVERQFNVYNLLPDRNLEKNTTKENNTEEHVFTLDGSFENDFYDNDYNISIDGPLVEQLNQNISNVHIENMTIDGIDEINNEPNTDGGDERQSINETDLSKGIPNYAVSDKTSHQEEIEITSIRSYNSPLINKMSQNVNLVTEQSIWNSSRFQGDNTNHDISSSSTEEDDLNLIRRPSYHIFGREYEFYDQLVDGLSEENVSRENIDIPDSSDNISTNTTDLLPNVHLLLVTTETPETKEWRKRILEEEIKLLRLKQKLIQHQVMIMLCSHTFILFCEIIFYSVKKLFSKSCS